MFCSESCEEILPLLLERYLGSSNGDFAFAKASSNSKVVRDSINFEC